ncbi:tetratricopeptide repeat protein [Algiphilus sp.]|uniref:tetratricopeptide repeat protein n=1 Tax=Algiphilus sp. TaxID=1872431 RepID=UPI003B519E8C
MVSAPVAMTRGLLVVLALALGACGTLPHERTTGTVFESAPSETDGQRSDRAAAGERERQAPRDGTEVAIYQPPATEQPESLTERHPRSLSEVSGPAVVSLVQQADQAAREARYETAIAVLERALRIEPRNAFVWARLAEVRLQAGEAQQAAATADRANSLARGNPYLEARNWRTLADARRQQGDAQGAQLARQKAEQARLRQTGGN